MSEYLVKDTSLTALADVIREKTGLEGSIAFPDGFVEAIAGMQNGGGSPVTPDEKEVNFRDYDGTVLYSYSVEETKLLTELPPLPEHDGLICQGWIYDLNAIKSYNNPMDIFAMYITDNGKTRIYVSLTEGCTSPMLGVCPNGTVTVDWGDGTTPDILIGTSTSTVKWTPTHNYASVGKYVISLTVDGEMGLYGVSNETDGPAIFRHVSTSSDINIPYRTCIYKVEIGSGITSIGDYAFSYCRQLGTITIPNSVTSIGNYAFYYCHLLRAVVIPNGVTSIGTNAFYQLRSLRIIAIPSSITSVGDWAFGYCESLTTVTIPNGVPKIWSNMFSYCTTLRTITIPNSVTSIFTYSFQYCKSLRTITIPNSVTSVGAGSFNRCTSLQTCDFTSLTAIPTTQGNSTFGYVPADCKILVPASLYNKWTIATGWSYFADKFVAV